MSLDRTQRLWGRSKWDLYLRPRNEEDINIRNEQEEQGREGKEEGLDKIKTDWGRVAIISASATLGVKDIKGWDRPRGNTTRVPR